MDTHTFNAKAQIIFLFLIILIFSSCAKNSGFLISNVSKLKSDSVTIEFILNDEEFHSASWPTALDLISSKKVILVKDICPFWQNSDSMCYYLKKLEELPATQGHKMLDVINYFYAIMPIPLFYLENLDKTLMNNKIEKMITCESIKIYMKYINESDTIDFFKEPCKKFSFDLYSSKQIVFWCKLVADNSCEVRLSNFSDSVKITSNNHSEKFSSYSIDSLLEAKNEFRINNIIFKINP